MKKNIKLLLVLVATLFLTGCTTILKDKDGKAVIYTEKSVCETCNSNCETKFNDEVNNLSEEKENEENNDQIISKEEKIKVCKDECLKKGIDLSFSDSENIASTMCTSESYKGKEVGFRLYIRYKDGTYKEYKK